MKVLLTNLNVGSAIEYVGDVIRKWIQEYKEQPVTFVEYKQQTAESITYKALLKESPDVIVVNELYPRITSPVLFYKLTYPNTKVIIFAHSQHSLMAPKSENADRHNRYVTSMDLVSLSDCLYTLSAKKEKIHPKENLKFCPSEPEIFHNEIPWASRPNLFCVMGNIYPLKVCPEFLKLARNIPVQFDVYGEVVERFTDESYRTLYNEATNFNLRAKGLIPQEQVGKVLNQYKYIVFPHHGPESFCMMLHQAIMCGTIPIVLNDDSGKDFDPHWIDWADNLYFGVNNVKTLLENLTPLSKDKTDLTPVSKFISTEVMKRFDYNAFKTEFQKQLK